jgi:two-component system sensor histidine kinase GlrK
MNLSKAMNKTARAEEKDQISKLSEKHPRGLLSALKNRGPVFRLRPRPIMTIVIFSFLAVITPFLFSILHASFFIEHLADSSQQSVLEVVQVTRDGKLLLDQIKGAERAVKQYGLFHGSSFRDLVSSRISDLSHTAQILRTSQIADLAPALERFSSRLEALEKAVLNPRITDRELTSAVKQFDGIYDEANQISGQINKSVDAKMTDLKNLSNESRKFLFGESILVIPLALLLIIFFSILFGRSLRQLEVGITDLGDSKLSQPIKVTGPRDIRELGIKLNWLRLRLQELENEKQKFLRHMSHELKTPVANFQEGTSLLADEIPGPLTKAQREVVSILQTNVQQFKQHITNLLDYNLVKFNQGTHPSKISIPQLIDEISIAHKLAVEARGLKFKSVGPSHKLTSDRSMLKAALDNVISNAINFSPDNGVVDVTWKIKGENVDFLVTDDGPGLKPGEIDKIFAPFFQGEARRRGPLKGSGIGLSVAMECVKSLGGELLAKNELNRGASFSISIPDLEFCRG